MAATATASPASPRLPSPPPIAEDQLSPVPASPEQQKFFSNLDQAAARRIRPGTKAEDMAEGPPLVELSEIDSAFQLTEHLKALHHFLTHPLGADGKVPVDKDMALRLAQPPDGVDKTLWLYELCRFLTQKVNAIIVALFSDTPACSSITCPEMRASEWQYLCAVHDPPKSCGAIDYCCHTLDWAANTLTSPKHFPSRLALGADQSTQHSQIRQLTNIFRRVYRIFAHAWFQHRDMFWKVEGDTGLYILFKTVCDVYGLIPEDNYTIPPEAEGIEPPTETTSSLPPMILKREPSDSAPHEKESAVNIEGLSTAGTTKRHRHSPSVGATSVTTVVEEAEEEEDQSKNTRRPDDGRQDDGKRVANMFESTPEEEEEEEGEEKEAVVTEAGADEAAEVSEQAGEASTEAKTEIETETEVETKVEARDEAKASTAEEVGGAASEVKESTAEGSEAESSTATEPVEVSADEHAISHSEEEEKVAKTEMGTEAESESEKSEKGEADAGAAAEAAAEAETADKAEQGGEGGKSGESER